MVDYTPLVKVNLISRLTVLTTTILFVLAGFANRANAAPGGGGENQFDVSITLFSTLAAINAAGYDAEIDSPSNYPIRAQIRAEIAKRNIPVLPELRAFYRDHRLSNDTATLSQYISFALLASDPPNFSLKDTDDLPADVEPLLGFSELLSRFYKEAHLEDLWARSQPAYLSAIEIYQEPVINTLLEANGYLRNVTSGDIGRRFQVYLSLLAAPNQVQVRSYKGDYFVVVTPAQQPSVSEIRAAYLAYLLDPLSLRYSRDISVKKSLQKYAEQAPALDEAYKGEFSLLVTQCLIHAIEARLTHDADKRQQYVDQSMREGFILTAAFNDLLGEYEKQPSAMRLYYPELINAIDVEKERKRIRQVHFVQALTPKVIVQPQSVQQRNQVEQSLQTAESLYEQKDYDGARKLFKLVLEKSPDQTFHGRAYYGLARIAVHDNQREQAISLFQKVVNANPDPQITAWSHVFLGRLALAAGDPQTATAQLKQVLGIDGASPKAREAAQTDLQKLSGDQQQ